MRAVAAALALALVAVVLFSVVPVAADAYIAPSGCGSFSQYDSSHGCAHAADGSDPYVYGSGGESFYRSQLPSSAVRYQEQVTYDLGRSFQVDGFLLSDGCVGSMTGTGSGCESNAVALLWSTDGSTYTQYSACLQGNYCGGHTVGDGSDANFCDTANNSCSHPSGTSGGCNFDTASPGLCSLGVYVTARYWRIEAVDSSISFAWIVNEWHLFGIASTPSSLVAMPSTATVVKGHSFAWSFQGTDSAGGDVSEVGHVSYTGSSPSGALTGCVWSSGLLVCVASGSVGSYVLEWADTSGNATVSGLVITGVTAGFVLVPALCSVPVGGSCTFHNQSTDASGTDTSAVDAWSFSSVPSGVGCGVPYFANGATYVKCYPTTVTGSPFTLTAADAGLHTATATITVSLSINPGGCSGTDVGCWLGNVVQLLVTLPTEIGQAVWAFLFVSESGKSFVDLSGLQLIPLLTCRAGEIPSAPDGVHCYPFPFAVPAEIGAIFSILLVDPVPPVVTWNFAVVPGHVTIDPSTILTPTVMGWWRAVEYVLFVTSLGLAVRKYVEAFGVD